MKKPAQNPFIQRLAPYALADLAVPPGQTLVSLAQNELSYAPGDDVLAAASRAMTRANRYPDPDWTDLTRAIAGVHHLDRERILCGAGSMELLEVLGRVYLSGSSHVVTSEYGYSFFRTVAAMYGAQVAIAAEQGYTVDVDALLRLVAPHTTMVFVANPGNPTGTLLSAGEIRRLRSALDESVLLVLDEAYAEFADTDDHPPLFDLVDRGDTVVLRTFSKIYGLAGMRVGWGYFPPDILGAVRKVLNPNNVSQASQAAAAVSIQRQDVVRQRRDATRRVRRDFRDRLHSLGLKTPDSHANFVLIEFPDACTAGACFAGLRAHGILMRPMQGYGLGHCLRATLADAEHLALALSHLSRLLGR